MRVLIFKGPKMSILKGSFQATVTFLLGAQTAAYICAGLVPAYPQLARSVCIMSMFQTKNSDSDWSHCLYGGFK